MPSRPLFRLTHRFCAVIPAAAILLGTFAPASAQTITTVAGGAVCDNASALAVAVAPGGTVSDAAGNLYVAALTSHAVCKITPSGAISRVAGTGTAGFSGDGGAATAAQLNYPNHVALDASGNLYIADSSNYRVRKVTPTGVISTVAGGGAGGDGGPAISAYLDHPSGLAIDSSGNLFIAETVSHRIRKVTPTGVISTIAGTGTAGYNGDGITATTAQLNSPYGIALDGSGNVYVADRSNQRVRMVSTTGTISTIAGTGASGFSGDGAAATAAQLNMPHSVALDASGNIYIADWQNQRVRKITKVDGKISTLAGTGAQGGAGDGGLASAAQLNYPQSLSLDSTGNLFVSDYSNYRVRKIAANNANITTVVGNGSPGWSGDGGAASAAQLGTYLHIAVDASGQIFISDSDNHRIRKVASNGTISTFAGTGTAGSSGDGGPASSAQLNAPAGIAFDASGNLYIVEQSGHRVRKVASDGSISTFAGNGTFGFGGDGAAATAANLAYPQGITTDASGNVYIADTINHRIRKVASDGTITTIAGNGTQGFGGDNGAAVAAQLNGPRAVRIDADDHLVIADTENHRVRKVSGNGTITTIAGTGTQGYSGDGAAATSAQLLLPSGLAFNPMGELNITDWYVHSVRKISRTGIIDRIVGSGGGNAGFAGDGGPAINALLNSPHDIAFDTNGNLYIADGANRRIRKVVQPYTKRAPSLLVSGPTTAVYGASITISVTIGGAYLPTGTVNVCRDGDVDPDTFCWPNFVFPCSALVLAPTANADEYTASCTTSTTPVGTHHFPALFTGDARNERNVNLIEVTISKAPQIITGFHATPASPAFTPNGSFTVAATGGGSSSPVTFTSTAASVCTVSGNQVTMHATGTCSLTANQQGDSNYLDAAPVTLNVPLGAQATTTTLAATIPSVYGQSVTLTASVDAATATGTITFREGASVLCAAVVVSNHAASCPLPASALDVGGHDYIAVYNGDTDYSASTSTPLHHTVNKAATALSVTTLAPSTITLGQSVTVTSTLVALAPGAGAPTGTITISDGAATCSYATPASDHCTLTPAAVGNRTLSANYAGDTHFLASNASATLQVNATASAIATPAPILSWWALLMLIALLAALTHRARAGM